MLRTIFFTIVITLIAYTCYIFPIHTLLILATNKGISIKGQLLATILTAVSILYYLRSKSTFILLRLFVYEGLGIGFFSLIAIGISTIISFITQIPPTFEWTLGLIIIMVMYSTYNAKKIIVKTISIESKKITSPVSVVFVSDLHCGTNSQVHLQKIVDKINQQNPDIILIGGDLIDSSSFKISRLDCFKQFKQPIYFVTGNHEYYLKHSTELINNLGNYNIQVLTNESVMANGLQIIGLPDNQTISQHQTHSTRLINNEVFSIMMVHKPKLWETITTPPDLMLSGHTHNGQIWPFNWLVKRQFKYIYGKYNIKQSTLYVSCGAATWGPKMRLGSTSEIIYFKINNQ